MFEAALCIFATCYTAAVATQEPGRWDVALVWSVVAVAILATTLMLVADGEAPLTLGALLVAAGLNAAGFVALGDESTFVSWLTVLTCASCLLQAGYVGFNTLRRSAT